MNVEDINPMNVGKRLEALNEEYRAKNGSNYPKEHLNAPVGKLEGLQSCLICNGEGSYAIPNGFDDVEFVPCEDCGGNGYITKGLASWERAEARQKMGLNKHQRI